MPTINLPAAMTLRTPTLTVDLPAGESLVPDAVAEALAGITPGPADLLDRPIPDLAAELALVTDVAVIDAMLAAETAGKTRRGAIAALEKRKAELDG